ncbi:MAG: sulfotransferase [Planctomycetota bacterium]
MSPSTNIPQLNTSKRTATVQSLRNKLADRKHDELFKELAELPPKLAKDPEVLFVKAIACERIKRTADAIRAAKQSLELMEHPNTMLVLARCYRHTGETELCLQWCERAAKQQTNIASIDMIRGGALEEAGRFDEATQVLQPYVERHTAEGTELPMPLGIEWSKLLVQNKQYGEAISLIDKTLEIPEAPPELRSVQLHLKAKACDRKKDFAEAWAAAEEANAIGRLEFSPELYEEQVSTLMEIWSQEHMQKFPLANCEDELPIFVAGMPRSGTSLIDQIIDAHPLASGVGELNSIERFAYDLSRVYDPEKEPPKCFGKYDAYRWTRTAKDYVKQLRSIAPSDAERVVNKALGNNKLVGLIARLFPKTRIIHAIRDPRDVAISCFMGGFNNRLHPWTTRVEWAAKAWEQSWRMMEHWKATLDVPILDVHYENLVENPEEEFPRIIDFLGLDWDDRCFEFHKSRRTVRTLSYDQVNRPLYKTSSGRHKNYASFIEEVEFPAYVR